MNDTISRREAIEAIKRTIWNKQTAKDAIDAICNIPSAQKNGDIDEAVEYIKNAQEYLRDIGETWYANCLSDAIELLVGEKRGEEDETDS